MGRKGLASISMPYLITLIIALGLFVVAIMASQALSEEVSQSVNDLGRISSANFYTESFFYDTLPLGSAYSLHQKAFELGAEGGGEDISWNEESLARATGEGEDGEIRILDPIYQKYRQNSIDYLREKYPTSDTGTVCSLENPIEPEILLADDLPTEKHQENVSFSVEVPEISTVCNFPGGEVGYQGSSEDFNAADRADDNRYLTMANRTARYFHNVRDELSQVSDKYYAEAGPYCDEPVRAQREAEQDAVGQANGDVSGAWSSANSDFDDWRGLIFIKREIISSQNFRFTSSNTWEGRVYTRKEDVGDCECTPLQGCKTLWLGKSTVNPQLTEVDYSLKDDRYRIPTEEGWKHLFFNVTTYNHHYQND